MNQNQRDTLTTCLTQVFGRVEDSFVDAAIPLLTWHELSGGETLITEGDPADGVYFVISGRLRAYITENDKPRSIGQIGRGETVGEMGVLTGEPRSASVVAIRDTVLAHASRDSFEELWRRHPQLPIHMARIVIERLRRASTRSRVKRPATLCLLPITDGVNLRELAEQLVTALDRWGVSTLETNDRIDSRFGAGAAVNTQRDSEQHHRVTTWLDDVEFWNDFVLLMADDDDTEWTQRCIRHADEILLVARADAPVRIHPLEQRLSNQSQSISGARQTLVLLHGGDRKHPSNTTSWLDRRPVDAHLHIRPELPRDIARLARVLSGNANGLVLAGGGARGFAHLGAFKALEEAGVEIDFVGGTSIGAAMAAYISMGLPAERLIECARKTFSGNPTGDFNLIPLISLIGGRRLRKVTKTGIVEAVGFLPDVADSWKTLYCVASSYSGASEVVIRRGSLERAVCASVSIPVALPPILWNGELLIDGGVFNNFPTDIMANLGARNIIGVDLARKNTRRYDFEEVPGTWELLRDRFRSRSKRRYALPSLGTVLLGTTVLYSESRRDAARNSVDLYLNPELAGVSLLDWKGFDRIVDLGYQHTIEVLAGMSEQELSPYRNELPPLEQLIA
jgi:NTE family protein